MRGKDALQQYQVSSSTFLFRMETETAVLGIAQNSILLMRGKVHNLEQTSPFLPTCDYTCRILADPGKIDITIRYKGNILPSLPLTFCVTMRATLTTPSFDNTDDPQLLQRLALQRTLRTASYNAANLS